MSDGRQDPDVEAVRRASLRVAWQVAGVSTGIVVGILVLAGLFIVDQSRPSELLERARPGETRIYVDATEVLIALVVLGAGAVVVVGFAGWVISRRAVRPLGEALRMQRAFVADASHELRTPLTVLDSRLQVLDRKLQRGDPAAPTLSAARRDVRIMIDLVTDLLLVAEGSATGVGGPDGGADLRPVVLAAVQDLRLLADERGVALRVEVRNEARVPLTEPSLRRALIVLVDNAIAHSPGGGEVVVTAVVERGRAIVRVRDAGGGVVGIAPDRVFERFAHGPETGRRRGFGIGLSLVRDLAVRSGGRVAVESTSERGTTMRLELPLR